MCAQCTCYYYNMTFSTGYFGHRVLSKEINSEWKSNIFIKLIVAANTSPVIRPKCVQYTILCAEKKNLYIYLQTHTYILTNIHNYYFILFALLILVLSTLEP